MRNLPIFKSWQLIQNIFKTLYGPKRKKKKKSLPAETVTSLVRARKCLFFTCPWALPTPHFLPFPKYAMYFALLFHTDLAAKNDHLVLCLETPTHPSGPSPNINSPAEVHLPRGGRVCFCREGRSAYRVYGDPYKPGGALL